MATVLDILQNLKAVFLQFGYFLFFLIVAAHEAAQIWTQYTKAIGNS